MRQRITRIRGTFRQALSTRKSRRWWGAGAAGAALATTVLLAVLAGCGDLPLFPRDLILSPAKLNVEEGARATVVRTGGLPPFGYALTSSAPEAGSFDPVTLEYAAPAALEAGDISLLVLLTVTDYAGKQAQSEITVFRTFAITPRQATVAIGDTLDLTIWGGVPPYEYSASAGTIDQTAGGPPAVATYTPPDEVASGVVVTVLDAAGNEAEARIEVVEAGTLIVNPQSVSLLVGETQEFEVTGGVPPYTFSAGGGGSVDPTSADEDPAYFTYEAPPDPVVDEVEVSDSNPEPQVVRITVYVGMPLTLSPATAQVRPGQQVTFSATGGSSPYKWSNSGGGMLTEIPGNGSSILYTAPGQLGIDWVTVEDQVDQTRKAKVSIRRN